MYLVALTRFLISYPIMSGIVTDCIADHLPSFQLSEIGGVVNKNKTTQCFSKHRLLKFRDKARTIDLSATYYKENLDDALEVIYNGIDKCMPVFDI